MVFLYQPHNVRLQNYVMQNDGRHKADSLLLQTCMCFFYSGRRPLREQTVVTLDHDVTNLVEFRNLRVQHKSR